MIPASPRSCSILATTLKLRHVEPLLILLSRSNLWLPLKSNLYLGCTLATLASALAAPAVTPATQPELWERIRRFELDDPNAAFSFTDRLARENGWSMSLALQAVQEYKKFMFLLCIAPHPLTPSDQVDQVWHLHLLYTRSYWLEFCEQVLGRAMHHGPTKGGAAEQDKFDDWYARTKQLYEATFGTVPPPDLWPDSETRFQEINFRRVNLDAYWLIPKPRFRRP